MSLPLPLKVFRTRGLGELAVKRLDLFKRVFLFRAGVTRRERLTPTVKGAYRTPHPTAASRTPILVFPREIPAGPSGPVSDLCADIEEHLRLRFRGKPVGIAWALKDVAFSRETLEGLWLETFPDAEVLRLSDAGHYLQEDAHEQIVPALIEHLGR